MTTSGAAQVTLSADEQILITREFDAPKHLVYRAFTTPELVRRWWHARRGTITVCEIDLRVGGVALRDGHRRRVRGRLPRRVPRDRLERAARPDRPLRSVPEGVGEEEAVNTVTLTEADGRTTMTILVQHSSKEHRDGHIESGMEAGLQDALDLLEVVARSLR